MAASWPTAPSGVRGKPVGTSAAPMPVEGGTTSAGAGEAAVLQCYRVSPGPDFVLVVQVTDMPAYHALAHRLFTAHANVRNVKAYFSTHRSKFETRIAV